MTDYANLTPEEESALVPDWITIQRSPLGYRRWISLSGETVFEEYFPRGASTCKLHSKGPWEMDWRLASKLAEVLQFFVINRKLPKRIGE